MATKYVITAEQKAEIEQARKANKNKRTEAKLKVLIMRADGASAKGVGTYVDASAVAAALAPLYDVTLTFCFEKDGVLADPDDASSVIPEIRKEDFESLRKDGVVSEGMLPKLENAFKAIDAGVNKVVITNAAKLGKDSGTEII